MISYARNHEDVVLSRALRADRPGFYIDVGAGHPVEDSVTKHFYDLGWSGVNVEPAGGVFEALAEQRARDVNLDVALGAGPASGGATPTTTLADVCERFAQPTVDFLSVRVAGRAREVLEGGDWTRWKPRVVVVEAAGAGGWERVLLDAGYVVAGFDGVSRFHAPAGEIELRAALAVPANVTDDFVPYRYSRQIAELRNDLGAAGQQLAAARSLSATLSDDLKEQSGLTERYRDLQQRLQEAQRVLVMTRRGLADAQALYLQLLDEVVDARTQGDELRHQLEGIDPIGMGLARRVTALSARLPGPFEAAHRVAALRLALKKARGWVPE